MKEIIKVDHLTKDYGMNRGNFDVTFSVEKGEVFGFLGPNGSGKTTTIRHLLGYSKPQKGKTYINGMDAWKYPSLIQQNLGYVPGEIAFPDHMTGWKFIKEVATMRGIKDDKKIKELCDYFELKPYGVLKRMSKGMKQKIALVIAFMHDPDIIILDEPTSGLDPLMQDKFCRLILEEKKKGKTILMSSHIFGEVEKTCDRVAIIKQGKIIAQIKVKDIEHKREKEFEIRFKDKKDAVEFMTKDYNFKEKNVNKNRIKVMVEDDQINEFLKELTKFKIEYISEIKYTLEDYFMKYYQEKEQK